MSSISSDQRMHIEILGQSFSIKTDDSPEYVQSLVSELKQRYAVISTRMGVADPLRVAILAGLFLLDDLKKTQSQLPFGSEGGSRPVSAGSAGKPSGNASSAARENTPAQSTLAGLDEEQILAQLDKRLGELGL